MTTQPIQIAEELSDRLSEQAARRQITLEQLIERLLSEDSARLIMADDDLDVPVPPAGSDEAIAAVHRLTTLFAHVDLPDLDQALVDPMIALVNVFVYAFSG
ncbi:MAG: hypothetical protein ACRDGS_03275 [Chloroflexota bacterium]